MSAAMNSSNRRSADRTASSSHSRSLCLVLSARRSQRTRLLRFFPLFHPRTAYLHLPLARRRALIAIESTRHGDNQRPQIQQQLDEKKLKIDQETERCAFLDRSACGASTALNQFYSWLSQPELIARSLLISRCIMCSYILNLINEGAGQHSTNDDKQAPGQLPRVFDDVIRGLYNAMACDAACLRNCCSFAFVRLPITLRSHSAQFAPFLHSPAALRTMTNKGAASAPDEKSETILPGSVV